MSWTRGDFRVARRVGGPEGGEGDPVLAAWQPRAGARLRRRSGRARAGPDGSAVPVGRVSSGNFSPTLGHGIALAFVDPSVSEGDDVLLDARGQSVPATCVGIPFLPRS